MRVVLRPALLFLTAGIALFGQVNERELRQAVVKPLALMQTTSLTWFEKSACSTCHQQTLPMVAFDLARRRGVTLDHNALQRTVDKTLDYLADLDLAIQGSHSGDAAYVGYRLVVAEPLGLPPSASTGAYARLMSRRQLPDGHWASYDDRPPQSSSLFSMTAYAVQTLQKFLPETMAVERRSRVARAGVWLERSSPSNTEDRAYQLFGLSWAGRSASALAGQRDELLALQRPDGGWAQLPGLGSDAYSTGEALAAIHQAAGLPITSAAYQKRCALSAQHTEAGWNVVRGQPAARAGSAVPAFC